MSGNNARADACHISDIFFVLLPQEMERPCSAEPMKCWYPSNLTSVETGAVGPPRRFRVHAPNNPFTI